MENEKEITWDEILGLKNGKGINWKWLIENEYDDGAKQIFEEMAKQEVNSKSWEQQNFKDNWNTR